MCWLHFRRIEIIISICNIFQIEFTAGMTTSQSKLLLQLAKQQKIVPKSRFHEDAIEELFSTICKLEPKNLMLVEFLSMVIEKDLVKNSHKISEFVELYEEVKGKTLEHDPLNKNVMEMEEQKFNKKKFIKAMKDLAKKIYPGYPNAYETIYFDRITAVEPSDYRLRVDDHFKKYLTKEMVSLLVDYDKQFQTLYEVYMPENFNHGLNFSWEEISLLQKKIPIICVVRMLSEADVIPQFISAAQFIEIISKLKPLNSTHSSNITNKEVMFYTVDTIASYIRDHISSPPIKLLEGDIGLTYFQFQILFIRLATEFAKDQKNDFPAYLRKFMTYIQAKEALDQLASKRNKLQSTVQNYLKSLQAQNKGNKVSIKKRQSKTKIQQLYDVKDQQLKEQAAKNIYRCITVSKNQIEAIKRDLDGELGELVPKKKIQKQNQGYFNVDQKHVVIGEQLPKIQQKNKAVVSKDSKKKNEDDFLGYKAQLPKVIEESATTKMIRRPKKIRINNEFPIILNEIFYPSHIISNMQLPDQAQVYLETSYIHLGERLYEEGFINYSKAKVLCEPKTQLMKYYFEVHAAQIFESAGKDQIALSFYNKAKQQSLPLTSSEFYAKAYPYIGIGSCFYHLENYQYALRCFEKAKVMFGFNLQVQSIQNAIIQNNIGCCLMMINRNQEAVKYFEVSHNILDLQLGRFDQRTLVIQQNLSKNRKAHLELMPEFKTLWKTYVEKSTAKLPAVKGKPVKK